MIMTLTDLEGNTLFWSSAGKLGFKGTKKGTSFAASKVAEAISYAVKKAKIKEVKVVVEGIGAGRVSALKSLAANGLNITSIKDTTSIPHNGCRARGPRRN
jgi:small subunit ribosomal protein S11